MLGNMNKTKKNTIKGGSNTNIFSDYSASEIQRRLDNYVAAAYALKQTTDTIKNTVESKLSSSSNSTYQLQNNNSQQFALATSKLSSLIHQFNTNLLRNQALPSYVAPPIPTVLMEAIPPSPQPRPAPSPIPAPAPVPQPRPGPVPQPRPAPVPQPRPATASAPSPRPATSPAPAPSPRPAPSP